MYEHFIRVESECVVSAMGTVVGSRATASSNRQAFGITLDWYNETQQNETDRDIYMCMRFVFDCLKMCFVVIFVVVVFVYLRAKYIAMRFHQKKLFFVYKQANNTA